MLLPCLGMGGSNQICGHLTVEVTHHLGPPFLSLGMCPSLPVQPSCQALHGAPEPQGPAMFTSSAVSTEARVLPCEHLGDGDCPASQIIPLALGCSFGLAGNLMGQ